MGVSSSFNPNVVIPLIRRVYPSMMPVEGIYNEGYSVTLLPDRLADEVGKWTFLSKKRLKRQIRNFGNHWMHSVSINQLICTDGKVTHVKPRVFNIYTQEDIDSFMVELANLSDIHGIVKLRKGEIWVKEATDPKDLNIDSRIMDGFMDRLHGRIEVKIVNVDGTFTLDHVLLNP